MDDNHCPFCNSTDIRQAGDIRMECLNPLCLEWWNEYLLVSVEEPEVSQGT